MTGSTSDSQQRRHFGYWINRRSRRARCYECQFQFVGDDTTAEQWVGQPRPGQPDA
ncbi:hypothetical protein [Mycolicibacterium mucogenicum]|uniref:hypothetical protein n=1 Tax=Mycolicibacterium mucogenicum TaxID=56689 RepID=UPI00140A0FB9|nr:hypothetical protein [Mycolicibacterium mucogenicum]